MVDLLFELGTEELPARFVIPALDDIERVFTTECAARGLTHAAIRRFGTPRRLALLVSDVLERTPDLVKTLQGPPVKAAFDEHGAPKVPALKFAESVKLTVEQLTRTATPKGEYLTAQVAEKGREARELLPEVLDACVRKINFAKSMRWGDVEQSFGRPLHWIVALLGREVLPVRFSDVTSGRTTRGHRFLAPAAIEIDEPSQYERALERAHVIADIDKRRALLVERLAERAREAQGKLIEDPELVEQVTNLVELPNPVLGSFEARHLDLPPEVLIQEMKSHQRYFSLADAAGKLLPRFIAVSNTPVKDVALSLKGYERVLRARLTDGRFFFDEDRRTRLASRVEKLKRVTWQAKLNSSYFDKVERFKVLAGWLGQQTGHQALGQTIERAAQLSKADLVTGMVGEFPELQGVMGREYALHDGESAEVALAIFEHYLPRGANDALPTHDAGALIGLADRLDTLCGLFAIGEKPTGAKDQFGLRRAAIAFVNIVLARGYRFSLAAAVRESLASYGDKLSAEQRKNGEAQVLEFFRDRLRPLWGDGKRTDVVEAVLAAGCDDLVATRMRIDALVQYVERPDFAALAATFKRVANIVEKQAKDVVRGALDPSKLSDAAERELHAQLTTVSDAVHAAMRADRYSDAMAKVVPLRPFVDRFFESVMVMAEDRALRENRVRLLMEIAALFAGIADFSKIQSEA